MSGNARALRWLLCVCVVSACDRAPGMMAGDAPEWLAARAEPVRLTVSLDTTRSRSKRITPRGGTVSATSENGTRYSLRIPRDGLLSDQVITLTPVTRVDGLPLAGDSFAIVHIEPSGLILQKPAMLTIRTREDVPPSEQVAFGYQAAGEDAFLAPILPDERGRVRIPVLHFSGYGYGRAAPDDPGRIALQRTASVRARLVSRVSAELSRARQRALLGLDPIKSLSELIGEPAIEFYDAVVAPLLKAALENERMAPCAVQQYLAWERQQQLLGGGSAKRPPPNASTTTLELYQRSTEGRRMTQEIFREMTAALIENAIERCRSEHDFSVVNTIVSLNRQLVLLGAGPASGEITGLDEAMDCFTFEVEFRSVIDLQTPTGGQYYHVLAKIPFEMGTAEPQTAPLDYVAFRASGNPFQDLLGTDQVVTAIGDLGQFATTMAPAGTKPGTSRVVALEWDLNPWVTDITDCKGEDARGLRDRAMHFRVTIQPGVPTELMRHTYVDEGEQIQIAAVMEAWAEAIGADGTAAEFDRARVGEPFTTEENDWANKWAQRHRQQATTVENLDPEQGAAYLIPLDTLTRARGVWRADFESEEPTISGFSLTESGYIIVRHTPK